MNLLHFTLYVSLATVAFCPLHNKRTWWWWWWATTSPYC